ncbi:MAG: hypothetical protein AAGF81_17425 [Pseudomonadota bacterium]
MPDEGAAILQVKELRTVYQSRQGDVHAGTGVRVNLCPGELMDVVRPATP